ncbi:hypothetical protein BZA05DRAFT_181642 [Tricharina praecox]|uniref:uncharacterized protein n=1 Tax=Tricharina praecox TaxID=43433 RepID=UPI00221FA817|nr:uncharacterized protein BZA05DRAFT_181642 [Tricharina praecox]KAI5843569.1 hypothetical protein BZA05DRAFT_181642 [Tricharina praecox]
MKFTIASVAAIFILQAAATAVPAADAEIVQRAPDAEAAADYYEPKYKVKTVTEYKYKYKTATVTDYKYKYTTVYKKYPVTVTDYKYKYKYTTVYKKYPVTVTDYNTRPSPSTRPRTLTPSPSPSPRPRTPTPSQSPSPRPRTPTPSPSPSPRPRTPTPSPSPSPRPRTPTPSPSPRPRPRPTTRPSPSPPRTSTTKCMYLALFRRDPSPFLPFVLGGSEILRVAVCICIIIRPSFSVSSPISSQVSLGGFFSPLGHLGFWFFFRGARIISRVSFFTTTFFLF